MLLFHNSLLDSYLIPTVLSRRSAAHAVIVSIACCRAHNVNTLLDLRGCTFAYSDEDSLSGSKIVLKTLKGKGENASFFGSLLSTIY